MYEIPSTPPESPRPAVDPEQLRSAMLLYRKLAAFKAESVHVKDYLVDENGLGSALDAAFLPPAEREEAETNSSQFEGFVKAPDAYMGMHSVTVDLFGEGATDARGILAMVLVDVDNPLTHKPGERFIGHNIYKLYPDGNVQQTQKGEHADGSNLWEQTWMDRAQIDALDQELIQKLEPGEA